MESLDSSWHRKEEVVREIAGSGSASSAGIFPYLDIRRINASSRRVPLPSSLHERPTAARHIIRRTKTLPDQENIGTGYLRIASPKGQAWHAHYIEKERATTLSRVTLAASLTDIRDRHTRLSFDM